VAGPAFDRPRTFFLGLLLFFFVFPTFLEAEVLMRLRTSRPPPSGPRAAVLQTIAPRHEVTRVLATNLWHGQAKLDRAPATDTHPHHGSSASGAALFVESSTGRALMPCNEVPLPAGVFAAPGYMHWFR